MSAQQAQKDEQNPYIGRSRPSTPRATPITPRGTGDSLLDVEKARYERAQQLKAEQEAEKARRAALAAAAQQQAGLGDPALDFPDVEQQQLQLARKAPTQALDPRSPRKHTDRHSPRGNYAPAALADKTKVVQKE